jgi:hypothetical protein
VPSAQLLHHPELAVLVAQLFVVREGAVDCGEEEFRRQCVGEAAAVASVRRVKSLLHLRLGPLLDPQLKRDAPLKLVGDERARPRAIGPSR